MPIHRPWFLFGHSRETSHFLVDGLDRCWGERKAVHVGVRRLHIELDNGPEIGSSRTELLKRMVEFVYRHGVAVELVYLPPYHSKYNPIERCWGILERHWNGTLLGSAAELGEADRERWRALRESLERRRQRRVERRQFRRDPEKYLKSLENKIIQSSLPSQKKTRARTARWSTG